jgi:hypothetical protein
MFNLDQDSLVKEIQRDAAYFIEEREEILECDENLIEIDEQEESSPRHKALGRLRNGTERSAFRKIDFSKIEVLEESEEKHQYRKNSVFGKGQGERKSVSQMEESMMSGPLSGRRRFSSVGNCTIMGEGGHNFDKKNENKFCCQLI